jgi:hypothetical protein
MINHHQLAKIVGRDVSEDDGKRLVLAMTRTLAGSEEEVLRFTEVFYDLIKPEATTMEIITAAKELGVLSKVSVDRAANLTDKVNRPRILRQLVGPKSSSRALMIVAAFVSGVYSASSSLLNSWKATRLLIKSGNFAREWRPVPLILVQKPVEWEWVDDPAQDMVRRRQISEFGRSDLQVAKVWKLKR